MTLNITVLERNRIYQSSDFRLTEQPSGKVLTDSSTKAITIQNSEFMGLLTYTGLGQWKGKDTREWILDWLVDLGDVALDDVSAGLAERASAWLQTLSPRGNPHGLTLVLASFREDGSDAKVTVISNVEDVTGEVRTASLPMTVSSQRAGARPEVIITGWKPAVSRDSRRWLENVCRQHPDDPQRIRQAMVDTNAAAARSPCAEDKISSGCTVIAMVRDGSGGQSITPGDSVDVRGIHLGQKGPDLAKVLEELGMTGGAVASTSFARSGPRMTPPPCNPRLVGESDEYELIEFSAPDISNLIARDLNDVELLVGVADVAPGVHVGWRADGSALNPEVHRIADLQIESIAIGPSGEVIGGATKEAGLLAAFRWDGAKVHSLDDSISADNAARAMNASGVIVGWSSTSATDRGQLHYRPTIWHPHGETVVLTDFPGTWGEAIGIAEDGTTLLWLHDGFASLAALLSPSGELVVITGENGQASGFIPHGISSNGVVLGEVNTPNGRLAFTADRSARWELLGTPPGWNVQAIASDGTVAGFLAERGSERGWILPVGGNAQVPTLLPGYAHHECRPHAVNDNRDLVGEARTDHGTHGLLWRRRR